MPFCYNIIHSMYAPTQKLSWAHVYIYSLLWNMKTATAKVGGITQNIDLDMHDSRRSIIGYALLEQL